MKNQIKNIFQESIWVKEETLSKNIDELVRVIKEAVVTLKKGRKLMFMGNGGSAADSQHIAAEFIGRFKKERQAMAAIALTTDTSIITAIGNDYGYEKVFARQIEGLGKKGDLVFGLSTSGNSPNIIEGLKQAQRMGIKTVTLTGCSGGKMAKLSDYSLIVPSNDTARIQESHICLSHAMCELVENALLKK